MNSIAAKTKTIANVDTKENTWNELITDNIYTASIWGIAKVRQHENHEGFMVVVTYKDVVVGFFHVDEVKYR
jgi:hypothetical protein